MRAVVYVVAKAPRPGEVKTRLVPPLTPGEAAALANAFLADTFSVAAAANGVDVRAVCRSTVDAATVARCAPAGAEMYCQQQPGLGAALEEAFVHGLASGYNGVAVLGADSPTIGADILELAFASLANHDVAIGPCDDGGYYLLAAKSVHTQLFRDMVWSTDSVYAETIDRCHALNLSVASLPRRFDVDTPDELQRLVAELRLRPATIAPATRAALSSLGMTSIDGGAPR
ncbi:MAG: TIGR04282 family arsenosugar biosynthesis glycosyltransferase [Chloroflexota bacterium]